MIASSSHLYMWEHSCEGQLQRPAVPVGESLLCSADNIFSTIAILLFCIIFFFDVSTGLTFLFVVWGKGLLVQYGRKSFQVKRRGRYSKKHSKIAATFRHNWTQELETFNDSESQTFEALFLRVIFIFKLSLFKSVSDTGDYISKIHSFSCVNPLCFITEYDLVVQDIFLSPSPCVSDSMKIKRIRLACLDSTVRMPSLNLYTISFTPNGLICPQHIV